MQFEDIWSTVQKRSIWQPMIFIYMYTVTMVSRPEPPTAPAA